MQASHTPGPRATKALQESTVHNIISTGQGDVSMKWRTAGHSHFQLSYTGILWTVWLCILGKGQVACWKVWCRIGTLIEREPKTICNLPYPVSRHMANVQEGRSILLDCRRSGFVQGKLPIIFILMLTACRGDDITPLRCGAWSFIDRYQHFGVMLLFTKLRSITYQKTNLYEKLVGRAGYWVESWIYCLHNTWSLLYLTVSLLVLWCTLEVPNWVSVMVHFVHTSCKLILLLWKKNRFYSTPSLCCRCL